MAGDQFEQRTKTARIGKMRACVCFFDAGSFRRKLLEASPPSKYYFLRCRIFALMRRFLRPTFRRPFPVFLVPTFGCLFLSNDRPWPIRTMIWISIRFGKSNKSSRSSPMLCHNQIVNRHKLGCRSFARAVGRANSYYGFDRCEHQGVEFDTVIVSSYESVRGLFWTKLKPTLNLFGGRKFGDKLSNSWHLRAF